MPELLTKTTPAPNIQHLRLNQPGQRNALSTAMIQALIDAVTAAQTDGTKALIIASTGPAWSAGQDIRELKSARQEPDQGARAFRAMMDQLIALMRLLTHGSVPIIAEVDGIVTGAGIQMLASCDMIYASPTSKFAAPGVNMGLLASPPMVAITRKVARVHAAELLFTGQAIDADDAARIGLINQVTDDPGAKALEVARTIASKSLRVVRAGKQALAPQADMPLADAYEWILQPMLAGVLDGHADPAIDAFLEKRPPQWRD